MGTPGFTELASSHAFWNFGFHLAAPVCIGAGLYAASVHPLAISVFAAIPAASGMDLKCVVRGEAQ